jgi:uncharacterized caspase-like protein
LVRAQVSSRNPLAEVRVGAEAVVEAVGEHEARFERRLTLPASQRELQVRVADVAGNETHVRIPIATETPPPPPHLVGKRYLLSIGISRYESEELSVLPAAASDASALADLLERRASFPAESIVLLQDREATLAGVRASLASFLALLGPEDLAIVYFAGYGTHGLGGEADHVYLPCADTRLNQLQATALDLEELRRLLGEASRVTAHNLLLLFDVRSLDVLDQYLSGVNLVNSRLLQLYSEERGTTVLVAAGVGQDVQSREGPRGPAGLFAEALLAGLSAEADGNRDRVLTVAEWFGYVSASVRAQSEGAQDPRYRIVDRSTNVIRFAGS